MLKLERASLSPGGLVKTQVTGPIPGVLDGAENSSGDTGTVGLRTTGMGNPGSVVIKFNQELTLESLAK